MSLSPMYSLVQGIIKEQGEKICRSYSRISGVDILNVKTNDKSCMKVRIIDFWEH